MRFLTMLCILVFAQAFPQSTEASEVLKQLIDQVSASENRPVLLQSEAPASTFNATVFRNDTSLDVPESVLYALEAAAKKGVAGNWNAIVTGSDTFYDDVRCAPGDTIQNTLGDPKQDAIILVASLPLFDTRQDHCIVTLRIRASAEHEFGYTLMMKRIYGKWIPIEKYGYWTT